MLTPRETEILVHSSQGLPVKCIAPLLGISERTVEFHRGNAQRKLNAPNIIKACCDAVRLGLIPAIVGSLFLFSDSKQVRLDIESYQELNRVSNHAQQVRVTVDCIDDPLGLYDRSKVKICEDNK